MLHESCKIRLQRRMVFELSPRLDKLSRPWVTGRSLPFASTVLIKEIHERRIEGIRDFLQPIN